jgi:hypothetical protein
LSGIDNQFSQRLRRVWQWLRACVTIDTRALAAFRIVAGVLILADVVARSNRFTYFYTEDGVAPLSLARDLAPDYAFSFFFWTTNPTAIAILFALHALVGVSLIIGYQTRLATLLSFLFVISLDHRNVLVLSYADALFRLLLFWAIFLPLGARWSVDAVHRGGRPRATVASLASAAFLLQMFFMYFGNAIQKFAGDAWLSGEATPLIFGLDDMTWFLAPYLREFPTMLQYGGWTWFLMLTVFSWMLLLSVNRARTLIAGAFFIAHASFAATVRIGAFPYVAIAGLLPFLQTSFWDDLARAGRYLSQRLPGGPFSLSPLRRRLTLLARRFPRIRFDPGAVVPAPVRLWGGRLAVATAVVVILALPPLAFLERNGLSPLPVRGVERQTTQVASAFAVNQPPWTIFAPTPRTRDYSFVFPARTGNGEILDVFNERPLSFDRSSERLRHQYRHYRERFYMGHIQSHDEYGSVAPALAEHLCEHWSSDGDGSLTQINMYVIYEPVTMETISRPHERERHPELLYMHDCNGDQPVEIASPGF